MPTIEQLSSALVKADAAGDTVAAKAFADEIRRLKSTEQLTAPAEKPNEIPMGRRVLEMIRPTVEAGGSIAGGVLGTPLGPLGTLGGAGLGYGIAKGGLDVIEQLAGYQKPPADITQALLGGAKDVAIGATQEAAGRALVGPAVSKAAEYATTGLAKLRELPQQKAAKIARETLGTEADAVLNALRNAPPGVTPAQATAGINAPAWQALLERSGVRTPASTQYISNVLAQQEAARVNELARLAGGATATETRGVAEAMKTGANRVFEPMKEAALKGANLGRATQQYADEAAQAAEAATGAVQDVRRFVAAGERARGTQEFPVPGQPRVSTQITYRGDLARRADQVATDAAEGSLKFGEAARFSQAASDALSSHGIKPLKTDDLIAKITRIPKNPEFAGNADIPKVVQRVVDDIRQWTDNGGIIDAFALDAIRKNSVNAAIRDLYPAADKKVQKELAAGILTNIRPALVDAIEQAGGKGYREYLAAYSDQMRKVAEKKLTGEALRLYKDSPDQFVKLVQGESPDVVEKILGPGNYNIAKELSDDIMGSLKGVAGELERNKAVAKQASEGRDALRTVLESNVSKFKIPWGLSPKAAAVNKGLDVLETKLGAKVMSRLTEASKTAQSAEELLSALPAADRSKVLAAIRQFGVNVPKGTSAAVINALAPKSENALTEQ